MATKSPLQAKPASSRRAATRKPADGGELLFLWEGTDRRGSRVKGELRGPNPNLIKAELRRQGIVPLKVRKKPKPLFTMGQAVKPKDVMLFTRQMCTMLNSGIPVVQALGMVAQGIKKPKLRDVVLTIKADVEGGSTFADSLSKHPLYFNDLYVNLTRAGEEAGVLEVLLNKIAIYQEKTESIKSKIKKALLYPSIVLVVAFIVTAFILIFVIPQFESLFRGFGADLPAFTRFVITLSQLFQEWWYVIFGGIIAAVWAFFETKKRSRKFNQNLDRLSLRLPLFGNIFKLSANARFARTLSTMFAGGVPLVEALNSVAGATGNYVYERAVLEIRDAVATGQQLNFAMRQTTLFPDMVIQMVSIGEEAGSLSDMLAKVADFYEEELDNTVSSLTTLIEPMVMIILSVLVGGLVIAMYLPIFKLGSVV